MPLDCVQASMHHNCMKVNDIVKYSKPQKGEKDIRFVLRELNGDRVLIELIYDGGHQADRGCCCQRGLQSR
mgnify:CR=1 FL=1